MLQSANKKKKTRTQNRDAVSRRQRRGITEADRAQTGGETADKQMAAKWIDGLKGREKPSDRQTGRQTDGQFAGGQTGGQSERWDPASGEGRTGAPPPLRC